MLESFKQYSVPKKNVFVDSLDRRRPFSSFFPQKNVAMIIETGVSKKQQNEELWVYETETVYSKDEEEDIIANLEWRQCTQIPVRRVKSFTVQTSEKEVPSKFPKCYRIETENIFLTLQSLKDVSVSEGLYLMIQCISGYQALLYKNSQRKDRRYENINSINLQQCGINSKGQCRVGIKLWNGREQLQNLNTQAIIFKIIFMVSSLIIPTMRTQFNFLQQNLKKVNFLTFNRAQQIIKQFAKLRRIIIPKQIQIKSMRAFNPNGYSLPVKESVYNNPRKITSSCIADTKNPQTQQIIRSPSFISEKKTYFQSVKPRIVWNYPIISQKKANYKIPQMSIHINSQNIYYLPQNYKQMKMQPSQILKSNYFITNSDKTPVVYQQQHNFYPQKSQSMINLSPTTFKKSTIKQFPIPEQTIIQEQQHNQTPKKIIYKKNRLRIYPQYSIMQYQVNDTMINVHTSTNKSIKTTQCSELKSTRNHQNSTFPSTKYGNLMNYAEMKQSIYQENAFIDQKQSFHNKQQAQKHNNKIIVDDRPLSSDQKNAVTSKYNFGGLFPQIHCNNNKKQVQTQQNQKFVPKNQKQTKSINSNNNKTSFEFTKNNNIFDSICEEDEVILSHCVSSQKSFKGWKNTAKFLTDDKNQDLKESVYCGEELFCKQLTYDLTRLSKLGKLGRMIGKSTIPDSL